MQAKRGLLVITIVGWLALMVVLGWQVWASMWEQWAVSYDGDNHEAVTLHAARVLLTFVIALVVGPVFVAAAAALNRSKKTMWIFLGLTALLVVPAAVTARESYRTLHPPKPYRAPQNTHCVPVSGGRQCPGG